jgi:hypothetical protein
VSALDDIVGRIRDRIENFGVDDVCWPWTGARTRAGLRRQLVRDRDYRGFYVPVRVDAYGLVKTGRGKREVVHRVVYRWATQEVPKSEHFRLINTCGLTLCCNPTHWLLKDRRAPRRVGGAMPANPLAALRRDCEELLESQLATSAPRCFGDVQDHPYMADFPPELIKEVLRAIGKEHLAG